jgi:SAM-dependent methyltransferase
MDSSEIDVPVSAQTSPNSPRKKKIIALADQLASERQRWIERNRYFYENDRRYMRLLIPKGARVLDLGCGIGDLLAALEPSYGVGVDFSTNMIEEARQRYPHLEFCVGDIEDPSFMTSLEGRFDYIVLSDVIGSLDDCETTLEGIQALCTRNTRLVIAYHSNYWEWVLKIAELIHFKMPQEEQNFFADVDIIGLMNLTDFEVVRLTRRQLVPRQLLFLGPLVNRYIATLPVIQRLCLRNYVVGRSVRPPMVWPRSVTVVVPCRNERGNIEGAVSRTPRFCDDMEILFAEGHSSDGTLDEIYRVIDAYPQYDIKVIQQDGTGKADAVFKAFDQARGEVLMILDGDLTMPPESLPKFWKALAEGKGEFINGTRLVYPVEGQEMRFLNYLANRIFSVLFSWLLNQRLTDTLCGTKVLTRECYDKIKENRSYFGDFDPFGDFDLIFGAAKLNLRIVEVPIRYVPRTYGTTQISRFSHGLLLLRMVVFAYRKLKAF